MNLQTQPYSFQAIEPTADHDRTRAEHLAALRQYVENNCPYANLLHDIHIDFDEAGTLCLTGSVNSYYLRQVVVSFVVKAMKNNQISDRLKVTDLPVS